MIEVMLVDDHALVRMGFRMLLANADIEVVAEAETGEEACQQVPKVRPDVVVMDLSMPGMGGLEAVRRFVQARFADALAEVSAPVARDPKTELQERAMAVVGCFPSYRVVADSGVEGDDRRFTVEVSLRDESLAQATDRTKRAAEREAARIALVEARFEAHARAAGE